MFTLDNYINEKWEEQKTKPQIWCFMHEGHPLQISKMFDIYENETQDPDEAVVLTAQLPDGNWLACACSRRDITKWNLI